MCRPVPLVVLLLAAAPPRAADPPADAFGDPLPPGAVLRLGTTRLRHADLCVLAFTADKKLVSFGRDYVVRTWDPATGRQLAERAFEKEVVYHSAAGHLSPDAGRLAVQYADRVRVFDVASGRELAAVKLTDRFEAETRFSPDGGRLAVVDQMGKVQVCDVGANRCREVADLGNSHTADLAFSRDGRRLAVANFQHGVVAWDLAAGREVVRHNPENLRPVSVDFDGTGDVLAAVGWASAQPFEFVRVSTGRAPDGWSDPAPGARVEWVRFGPGGSTLLIGGRDGVRWFDPKAGKVVRTATGPATTRPAVSADGKLVASGGRSTIRIWDGASGKSVAPADIDGAPAGAVHGLAVSADGRTIVTKGYEDERTRVWDASGKLKATVGWPHSQDGYLAVSPDGRQLYGPARNGHVVARWDLPGGTESGVFRVTKPEDTSVRVFDVAVSADGRRLAAVTRWRAPSDESVVVVVWDVGTARQLGAYPIGPDTVSTRGALSPDLRWFVWAGRAVSLTGRPDYLLEVPARWEAEQAAVSPDGRLVAQTVFRLERRRQMSVAHSEGVHIYEAATGRRVRALPDLNWCELAFTPDGRGLVVANPDTLTRWDLVTGKPIVRHQAPSWLAGSFAASFASSLALFPDGKRAVTGHIDTTALVWDLTPPARPARKLSDRDLAAAWADLAGDDAAKAYAAIWALADAPADAVPFLRGRLKPTAAPTADEVRKLVARLDAPVFAQREAAAAAIRELGDAAAPALRAVLKGGLSAEQAGRVERLLAEAEAPVLPPGERLRRVRAVAALEWAGTTETRQLLAELAAGTAGDRPTREAQDAVRRLAVR